MARKDARDEDVRELKNRGYSERDAVLKSLKRSKADKKKEKKAMTVGPSGGADYPYGTRIDLDEDTLKKLGIKELPETGDELCLVASVKVLSTSAYSSDGEKPRRSLTLQMTKACLESEDDED